MQRAMIDRELSSLGAQVGLDDTYPVGDPTLEALWAVALIGADSLADDAVRRDLGEEAIEARAATHVAAALLVLNFGPEFIGAQLARRAA